MSSTLTTEYFDKRVKQSVGMPSPKFDASDADVIFQSCDDALFKIHRKNLETSSGGFPPSEFDTRGEIVQLTESSSTLDILFQYIYPVPQPDIASLSTEVLAEVAEAAEKYQVYPAIYVCKMVIEMSLPDNALNVFIYAGRHGHKNLLVNAAVHLVGTPLSEVISVIPSFLIVPWMKYYSTWEAQLRQARLYPSCNSRGLCSDLSTGHHFALINYIAKLEDVKALSNLDGVFGEIDARDRGNFMTYLRGWRSQIETNLKRMKGFDEFL